MRKMRIVVLLTIAALAFIGCSNRYTKSYTGERFSSSDQCELVTAELQSIREGKKVSIGELRERFEEVGYKVIGASYKRPVPLNGSHKLDVESTCERVGAQVALFDNGDQILYLRNDDGTNSGAIVSNVAKETLPMRKAPIVLGIIGAVLVLGLILQVAGN